MAVDKRPFLFILIKDLGIPKYSILKDKMSPLTQSVEDYLKAIYELEEDAGKVATNALAEKLGVLPGSVYGMIQKLSEDPHRLYG